MSEKKKKKVIIKDEKQIEIEKQKQKKLEEKRKQEEEEEKKQEEIDNKNLEEEIEWCINQLELGLKRKGVDFEQEMESREVMKKLSSKKLSKLSKRKIMKDVFGDVRGNFYSFLQN
jgi:dGTP triphosphohydrolase